MAELILLWYAFEAIVKLIQNFIKSLGHLTSNCLCSLLAGLIGPCVSTTLGWDEKRKHCEYSFNFLLASSFLPRTESSDLLSSGQEIFFRFLSSGFFLL